MKKKPKHTIVNLNELAIASEDNLADIQPKRNLLWLSIAPEFHLPEENSKRP